MDQVAALRHVDIFAAELDPVADRERDLASAAREVVDHADASRRVDLQAPIGAVGLLGPGSRG